MPPHRIAYWFEFPSLNGGERSCLAMLEHLDREHFAPVAVAPTEGPLADALRAAGVAVHPDPGGDLERIAWLRAERIDLVHANSLAMGCRSGPLGRQAGIPAVAHVRDIMRLGAVRREALGANRALIAVSDAAARALESEGLPAACIQVIRNGIDPHRPEAPPDPAARLRREMGWPADAPVIINLGQICLRKAQDVFLAAAAQVAAARPDARFLVVGARFSAKAESRAFETALHTTAAAPPLQGRVHFAGWRSDAIDLIAGATALAHAAHQEPLGRVLLEALAVGTPVVATRVGGTPEIVHNGVSGRLVPASDAEALAAALIETLENRAASRRFAAAGRERIREDFAPERATRAVSDLYRTLLPTS